MDRRPGDVLGEVKALVEDGALEVTFLGQNVNTYGVEFGDKLAFGKLLRAAGEIDGLERIRFTSPHPAAFTNDVIDAMAETPSVMPSLHMPLQSGSDTILKAMRRSYRSEKFLRILDDVRARIPNAAITGTMRPVASAWALDALPEGYIVSENERTGLPLLKKKTTV
jgi:tRNA-2-methylthio-N6-dimethylallyladenosine synthase